MKKFLMLVFLLMLTGTAFAGPGTNPDVRISDNEGDVAAINSAGAQIVSASATAIVSGEVNSISRFNYASIRSSNTTTVKSSAGVLHSVTVNSKGATHGLLTLFDGTSVVAPIIASIDTTITTGTFLYDVSFRTGLTVVNAGTTSADTTITYI